MTHYSATAPVPGASQYGWTGASTSASVIVGLRTKRFHAATMPGQPTGVSAGRPCDGPAAARSGGTDEGAPGESSLEVLPPGTVQMPHQDQHRLRPSKPAVADGPAIGADDKARIE